MCISVYETLYGKDIHLGILMHDISNCGCKGRVVVTVIYVAPLK